MENTKNLIKDVLKLMEQTKETKEINREETETTEEISPSQYEMFEKNISDMLLYSINQAEVIIEESMEYKEFETEIKKITKTLENTENKNTLAKIDKITALQILQNRVVERYMYKRGFKDCIRMLNILESI